jgi:starch-binding outer membrane protein, SusD/RagB family
MKKITLIFVLTFLVAISCTEDFVTLTPNNRKVVENFYETPKDALEGLVAAYAVLPWDGWGNIWLLSEVASDNTFGGTGKSDDGKTQNWDRFQKSTDPDLNADPWKKYTYGIYRANVVIENLGKVNWDGEDAMKNEFEAEARFLRAYYHFDWVRMFGNVPVLDKTLKPSEAFKDQSDPAVVYALIASDLKFAIENLPATKFGDISGEYFGRATKWAAEALMGRVFLFYTGYYNQPDLAGVVTKEEVRAYIDDVIDNSGHDLIQGADGFRRLWRASSIESGDYIGEDNVETVFAIKHTYKGLGDFAYDEGFGNRWQKFIGIRTQDIFPYAGGWGFCTVNEELVNAYEPGDQRKEASIIDIADEVPTFNTIDQRQYTGYAIKKFSPTLDANNKPTVVNLGGNDQLDGFDDLPVIRFSDVLLMGAELHIDGGDVGKAQAYLDRVRDRAFEDAAHRITVTKNAILEERRLELAFEGHRYFDLLRQGLDVAKAAIDHDDADSEFDVTFRPETGGFFEIPNSQINLSQGTLEQNAGF